MNKRFHTVLPVLLLCLLFALVPPATSMSLREVRGPYKYGGTLRIPILEDLTTLNPLISFKGVDIFAFTLLYPKLLINDPDWRFDAPYLASSYEISPDGKTYTFHLFPNATWDDGTPITSEDVKFSIEYYKKYSCPVTTPHVHNIDSVETPDPHTVVIHLVNASLSWIVVDLWMLYIIPKHIWQNVTDPLHFDNYPPVGAGPFKFSRWVKGQYIEFVANENFWFGRPYLDKVLLVVINTHDAQIMAFKEHAVDVVGIQGNEVPQFLGIPNVTIYQTIDPGLTVLGINNLKDPGRDINFRRAIAHTIDKERIINTVYYGYAKPNDNFLTIPYNISGRWLNPNVPKYSYNLTLAAELLDKAGYKDYDGDGWRDYPNGTKMKLYIETTGNIPTWIRAVEIIADDWRSIGLDTEVVAVDLGQQIADMVLTKNYQFTYYRCGPATSDPLEMLGWFLENQVSGGLNTAAWVNQTYEELYTLARNELDEAKLREIVWKMQLILTQELPNIPTVQGVGLRAVWTDKFEGFINCLPYGPLSNMDVYNFMSLHLRGPPPPMTASITLSVPSSCKVGETVTLKATLVDEKGNPIVNEYIDFIVGGTVIGSAATDSSGVAKLQYTPTSEGSFEVVATYRGSAHYASCSSEPSTLVVGAPPSPPPPPPDYTLYYVAIVIALILIAVLVLFMRKKT